MLAQFNSKTLSTSTLRAQTNLIARFVEEEKKKKKIADERFRLQE